MSTLRITNIEAKADPSSPTVDEKIKLTNSNGDILVHIDGKTSGITTIGINTTAGNIKFDQNSNVVVTGIITATKFVGTIEPTSLEIGSNIKLGNAGVITATSYVGDGSALTGIDATQIQTGNTSVQTVDTGSDGHVKINTEGTERLRITSAGNLGIGGLTNPGALLSIPAGESNTPRLAIESAVDDNDFTITQYEDGNGTYTMLGQNVKLNSGGNNTILDSAHRTAGILLDARNHGSIVFLTGGANAVGENVKITSAGEVQARRTRSNTVGDVALSIQPTDSTIHYGFRIDSANNNLNIDRVGTGNFITIASDGRMGVGTNSPGQGQTQINITAAGDDNYSAIALNLTNNSTNSGTGVSLRFSPGNIQTALRGSYINSLISGANGSDLQFWTCANGFAPSERLRITSGGKIQVTGTRGGTLQPSDNDSLELYTSATSGNASTGGGITFYNHDGSGHEMGGVIHVVKQNSTDNNTQSDMLFGTRLNGSNVAYRARLTSHGSWETYSSTVNIDIANSQSSGNNEAFIYARYGSTGLSAGSLSFRVYTNGNVANTNNSYGSISDVNLKENIVDATSQWNDIKALQVRKYNFREATGHQTHTQLGLIAQEVETVSPGLVETTAVREGETCQDADGNQLESIKSINYSVLYMKAVKALQEAQTRIETLETQLTDALARITALEGS